MQNGYFIGLGSNVAPARNIAGALTRLADLFGSLEISRIVETAPTEGFTGPFLNAVVYLRSELDSGELCGIVLERASARETALGANSASASVNSR